MQNTITEIKNSLEGGNSRIQEVEGRLVETTDTELKREKRLKTNEESLRELRDNVKRTNIHIIEVPEGEQRERTGQKKYSKR